MKEITKEEKDFIKSKLEKTLKISQKRKENKQKLINDILDMFSGDICNYENLMLDLCEEALKTRTQRELKTFFMTKVQIVVELDIDCSQDEVDIILSEMDYNFSHVIVEEGIGKQLTEIESIKNTEILERIK